MAGDSINQPHLREDLLASTGRHAWRVLLYLLAIAGAALFLLPLLFMVSSSLKPDYQILDFPPRWIPNPPRWQNYPEALTYVPFGRFTINTLIIASGAIIGNLLSCTLVAYGFARLSAPG